MKKFFAIGSMVLALLSVAGLASADCKIDCTPEGPSFHGCTRGEIAAFTPVACRVNGNGGSTVTTTTSTTSTTLPSSANNGFTGDNGFPTPRPRELLRCKFPRNFGKKLDLLTGTFPIGTHGRECDVRDGQDVVRCKRFNVGRGNKQHTFGCSLPL